MALIKCPECGQDVSDAADTCIHCGYPLRKAKQENLSPQGGNTIPKKEQTGLVTAIAMITVLAIVGGIIFYVRQATSSRALVKKAVEADLGQNIEITDLYYNSEDDRYLAGFNYDDGSDTALVNLTDNTVKYESVYRQVLAVANQTEGTDEYYDAARNVVNYEDFIILEYQITMKGLKDAGWEEVK